MDIMSIMQSRFNTTTTSASLDMPEKQKVAEPSQTTVTDSDDLSVMSRTFGLIDSVAGIGPPPISLDPQVHAERARTRIHELLEGMGIDPNTDIQISSQYGEIDYQIDHPEKDKIEKVLSEDGELRNSIIGGNNAALIQRAGKAARQAFEGIPENNVEARQRAVDWMLNFIRESQNMPYVLRYEGETVSSSYEDGSGKVVDYMNNFTVPKFA